VNNNIKELRRLMAYDLMISLIQEKQEFRMVIWNFNDWNKELPEDIMQKYPLQLILDINETVMEYCEIVDGILYLTACFGDEGEFWTKMFDLDDVVAITTIEGEVMIVNEFEPEIINPDVERDENGLKILDDKDISLRKNMSSKEVIEYIARDGISKEDAMRSLDAFKRNTAFIQEN